MSQEYEYIKVIVDCDVLLIQSKFKNNPTETRTLCDEDASDWSETDIRQYTKSLLCLDYDETKLVKVEYS